MKELWLTELRRETERKVRRASQLKLDGALFVWWINLVPPVANAIWEKANQ